MLEVSLFARTREGITASERQSGAVAIRTRDSRFWMPGSMQLAASSRLTIVEAVLLAIVLDRVCGVERDDQ